MFTSRTSESICHCLSEATGVPTAEWHVTVKFFYVGSLKRGEIIVRILLKNKILVILGVHNAQYSANTLQPHKKAPLAPCGTRGELRRDLGGSGPWTCPPTLHDGTPLRGRSTYCQPALRMPRSTVSPSSPFHQHRHHYQASIPLEASVHTRPAILQVPAIRGFPAVQGGHHNHTDAPSQRWVPGKG